MQHSKNLKHLPFYLLCVFNLLLASACGQGEVEGSKFHIPEELDQKASLRFRQYAVQGRLLYKQHCANCHQDDGSGLGQLIPPLAGSDYLQKNPEEIICLIRHGKKGPIVVNGLEYNQAMPPNPELTAIEIAEIATYIDNAWGNKGALVEANKAASILNECKERL